MTLITYGKKRLYNAVFYKLGECSLVVKDQQITEAFLLSHQSILQNCVRINPIKYHKLKAFFEGILS